MDVISEIIQNSKRQDINRRSKINILFLGASLKYIKKYISEYNVRINHRCLISACSENTIDVIQYLIEEHELTIDYECLVVACQYNTIEVIKYLSDEYSIIPTYDFLIMACGDNTIDVIKYLTSNYNLVPQRDCLLRACCHNGPDEINYLVSLYDVTIDIKCLEYACETNTVEVVSYIIENYNMYPSDKCFRYACGNNLDIIKYIAENYDKTPDDQCMIYARALNRVESYFDILTYFFTKYSIVNIVNLRWALPAEFIIEYFFDLTKRLNDNNIHISHLINQIVIFDDIDRDNLAIFFQNITDEYYTDVSLFLNYTNYTLDDFNKRIKTNRECKRIIKTNQNLPEDIANIIIDYLTIN